MNIKHIGKIALYFLGVISALLLTLFIYIRIVAQTDPPETSDLSPTEWKREKRNGLLKIKNNWFRKSESGLYELYVEGEPFERGVVIGKLAEELVQKQEKIFNDQINKMVPSGFHRNLLKYFIGWFNRDLDENVPEEFKKEIYGVSLSASHDYDYISSAYQRILNYHAAHDIGHALQNMSLVGCTSFAAWGNKSEDRSLIIGRNFDFFAGDDFAKDKIVAFYNPSSGYKFAMITWGGMTGVLSGMNEEGLTVTINAAKCDIPPGSATPVSIVAREILQYAKSIEEAYEIAKSREMFVAESFLIGSAYDHKAAIIEKDPTATVLYESAGESIICTNHFQSDELGNTELNLEHIQTSASPYRYKRVEQLLAHEGKLNVEKVARVLRNQKGLNDKDIGLGNEKAINQLIAHHGIIFQPEKKLMWISTEPWQLGKFVCYDLNQVFKLFLNEDREIHDPLQSIEQDNFLSTQEFKDYLKFAPYRFPFDSRDTLVPDSVVKWNPDSYLSYMLAGDAEFSQGSFDRALNFYTEGLKKEIATEQERTYMESRAETCASKLK